MNTFRHLRHALLIITVVGLFGCGKVIGFAPITQITAEEALPLINQDALFVDVRTPQEWQAGHIRDASLIPLDQIKATAETRLPNKHQPIVLYCRSGRRAAQAASILEEMGYDAISVIKGGYLNLKQAGYPAIEPSMASKTPQ